MAIWIKPTVPVKNVGLIGAGTMGRCMLESMIRGGFSVSVYDTFPSAAEKAAEKGGRIVSTPCELARECDIILLSLPGPRQIHDVIYGEHGIAGALRPGHVIVDTSTVDPETTKRTSAGLENTGAAYLDSPILGRPSAIGHWLMPTGGDKDAVSYVEPVLLTFASKVLRTGEIGSGNALKLLNQMMYSAINAVTSEVMAIADKVGIGKEIFYETVSASSAATVSGLFREVGQRIVNNDYEHPVFTVDLLIKDTALALQMSREANAPSVLTSLVQVYNELAHAIGFGNKDVSALYEVYNRQYREEPKH